jgi:uncharacterized protein (DUF983 family)
MDKVQPLNLTIQKKSVRKSPDADGKIDAGKSLVPGPGEVCPQCEKGILDYDGMLNLTCPICGHSFGGCFT